MMKPDRLLLLSAGLALTILLFFAPRPPHADSVKTSELMFLTLEISDQGISLVEWNTVSGTMKRERRDDGRSGIVYEAQSAAGATLWRGALDDPRIVRLESYDPATPGTIARQFVRRESAQFTIRVPREVTIDRIAFFNQSSAFGKDGRALVTRTPLVTVAWPSTRQGRKP